MPCLSLARNEDARKRLNSGWSDFLLGYNSPILFFFLSHLSLKEHEQIFTEGTTGSVYSKDVLLSLTKKDHYYYFSLYDT